MLQQKVRALQFLVFALLQGLFVFATLAAWLASQRQDHQPGKEESAELMYVGWGMLVAGVASSILVPKLLVRQQLSRIAQGYSPAASPSWSAEEAAWQSSEEGKLLSVFRTQLILSSGLLEGSGMVCCVITMVTGRYDLLVGAAVAVCLILLQFPLLPRVEAWIDQHRAQLDEWRNRPN